MAERKKVLILTYYWPPSGGTGVQRWLHFTRYLHELGWDPIIYTPSNPEAPVQDESLLAFVPKDIQVIQTEIWEPTQLYLKFTGNAGKTVAYTVSGVTSADISGASLTGNFTLDSSGDAFVVFNIATNAVPDDSKTLTLTIANGQTTSVSIVDDSVLIPICPPVLGPFAGSMNLMPSDPRYIV